MRGVFPLLVASAFVLSGCSGLPASDFHALALAAPGLLKLDAAPSGTLGGQSGSMTMDMTMHAQGQDVNIEMTMDLAMQYLQGGAYLSTVTMKDAKLNGESMPMQMKMTLFCSPTRIVVKTEGMGKTALDKDLENPIGSCPTSDGSLESLSQTHAIDPETAKLFKSISGQSVVPDMKFITTAKAGGKDVAVYEYNLSTSVSGLDLNMTIETRAHLSGSRISTMDLTGTADISGAVKDTAMTGHVDMTGRFEYSYGARDPIPAEYA